MARRRRNKIVLLPNPPMLNSESAEDFDALREAIELEIKPAGFIEHMYVADVSSIIWDIMRLRRCKGFIIDTAFRTALGHLLMRLLRKPHQLDYEVKEEAEELAPADELIGDEVEGPAIVRELRHDRWRACAR